MIPMDQIIAGIATFFATIALIAFGSVVAAWAVAWYRSPKMPKRVVGADVAHAPDHTAIATIEDDNVARVHRIETDGAGRIVAVKPLWERGEVVVPPAHPWDDAITEVVTITDPVRRDR